MKAKILIIDNNENFLTLIDSALHAHGFNTISLPATDNIFKVIMESKPDLILLDHLLWGSNGGELCRQIKENNRTAGIPVVLMSAYPSALNVFETYKCDAFMDKPFSIENLLACLKKQLREITPKVNEKEPRSVK